VENTGTRPHLIGVVVAGGVALVAILLLISMWGKVDRKTRELRESEQRFRNLLETVQLVAVTLDAKGRITFINDYALALAGYQRHEVLGKDWFELFVPLDMPEREELRASVGTESFPAHNDGIFTVRGGGHRLIAWSNTIVRDIQGNVVGVAGIGEDITERRQAQEALAASLKEKEVLLKEVYHRVKNNLQTVSSLLSLQADAVKDAPTRELFLESRSRVHSMAMVHERLYRSSTLADVDFRSYIETLANTHLRSSSLAGTVALELDVAEITLGIDRAITCGLILNELLSNSLKHAFPGERRGTIRIGMACRGKECVLSYADDGIGLPEGFVAEEKESLGMVLITGLAQQIRAKLEVQVEGGTNFTITFPVA
jgi:PAS domain S-box-containing protein